MQGKLKGIDVSRWQGLIDWPTVKNNVDFAIIKIGGSDDGFYQDGQAIRNVTEARAAGLLRGYYVFLGGYFSVQQEVAHIKNLLFAIGGLKPGEIFVLDWEQQHPQEVQYITGIVSGLKAAGIINPVIYMNLQHLNRSDWSPVVNLGTYLWLAAWGNNDAQIQPAEIPTSKQWPNMLLWQYSSTGSVPGIHARVDLDVFNGTSADFLAVGGAGNASFKAATVVPTATIPNALITEYTVNPGDTLSGISARYGRVWQDLFAINKDLISDPNRIFVGQKIRVWSVVSTPPPPPVVSEPIIAQAPKPPVVHIVANGENLSVIAARYNLPSWHVLYDANRGVIGGDPNLIRPNQRLVIP